MAYSFRTKSNFRAPWDNTMEQQEKYLIGRQPILDRNEQVYAYELLFRSANSLTQAAVNDASQATASVILNTLSGFGVQNILGKSLGFINLELDILLSEIGRASCRERW